MSTSSTYRPKAKKNASFPVKLYTLLELCDGSSPSLQRYPDGSSIVAWSSHGRAFEVRDEDRFMGEISPKFFRLTTISSFYRQLHLWGFRRFSKGPDIGSWYSPRFLRGQPALLKDMRRVKSKREIGMEHARAHPEPDLRALPPLTGLGNVPAYPRAHQPLSCVESIYVGRDNSSHQNSQRSMSWNVECRSPGPSSPQPEPRRISSSDEEEFENDSTKSEGRPYPRAHFSSRRASCDSFLESIERMQWTRDLDSNEYILDMTIEPIGVNETLRDDVLGESIHEVIETLR
ncbi:hypothetical protein THAOC_37230 [Thalassiosira oceanica]|uniref:HSF-type DNA-binding domain-containing protein n=2 Tax=Thalassiosira oceanica TaxID=159749 RepID=K0QYN0_THAOC|nr:hypothetical protein THAOC_37230 [Thalassiosira oceanica]|eukprot:EJK44248.1 hypothetical protein THAOC_37230 [Thalassiosira oceanica]